MVNVTGGNSGTQDPEHVYHFNAGSVFRINPCASHPYAEQYSPLESKDAKIGESVYCHIIIAHDSNLNCRFVDKNDYVEVSILLACPVKPFGFIC